MTERVKSVVVVGRDAPAWLAAAALQRAVGRGGIRIEVVELQSRLAPPDVYSAVPSIASMHRLLGLDERFVLQACDGLPMVAQRFSNWAKGAPPYFVAYDEDPPPGGDVPFAQYWAKAALEGLRVGFAEFSLGTACARLNAVPVPGAKPAPLDANYGYHLDARRYSQLAKQLALKLGVHAAAAAFVSATVDGERIAEIQLSDGTRLTADLYIDASGSEARLLGQLPGAEFESWAKWLPCDRVAVMSAPKLSTYPAFSQISAFDRGWVGLFPLQGRTAAIVAFSSAMISDDEVAEVAPVVARVPLSADAVVSNFRAGIQRTPWIGNCVSIGPSAIALDALDGLEIHVTHGCISHLIAVFPATSDEFPEADAFNRSIRTFAMNLRDFQAAHYLLNRRFDDPFWDRVREATPPASLKRKIDMFDARGLVPLNDHESFGEQSWAGLFVGSGLVPKGYDPRVDAIPAEMHVEKIQQRLREVAAIARAVPSVDRFLGLDQRSGVPLNGENANA